MENSVENLNKLFTPVLEKAKVMSKYLSERLIDHALDFQYGHHIKINGKLYSEGKPFKPDFEEFIVDLLFYSEMQFCYKGQYYGLNLTHDNDIEMWKFKSKKIQTFHTVEEFKNNAKVKGKLLKDIWNKTTDRNWL